MRHVLLERHWRPGFKPLRLVEAMRLLALCEEIAAPDSHVSICYDGKHSIRPDTASAYASQPPTNP